MMTPEELNDYIQYLRDQGMTEEQIDDCADSIGDVIEMDESGLIVMRGKSGKVVARIKPQPWDASSGQ